MQNQSSEAYERLLFGQDTSLIAWVMRLPEPDVLKLITKERSEIRRMPNPYRSAEGRRLACI